MMNPKNPVQLTEAAVNRIREIIADAHGDVLGLRVSVDKKGCNGFSYVIDYVNAAPEKDIKVEQDGVTLFIDPAASLYIYGSVMDFSTDKLRSSFTFTNPNEKGRCGCGESFHV